jgi:hypothetical protein
LTIINIICWFGHLAARMAASASMQVISVKPPFQYQQQNNFKKPVIIRCCSSSSTKKSYNITLLPGDGIGPEVISVAKNVLNLAGSIEGLLSIYNFLLFRCIYVFGLTAYSVILINEVFGKLF